MLGLHGSDTCLLYILIRYTTQRWIAFTQEALVYSEWLQIVGIDFFFFAPFLNILTAKMFPLLKKSSKCGGWKKKTGVEV